MDVKNKEFEQLEDVVLSNSQNEQLTRPIDLRIDVVVLIITFRKQNRVVVLIYSFFSQYLLTEDYMRQREVWAAVNIQR